MSTLQPLRFIAAVVLLAALPAHAAEIALDPTALQKLVEQGLFSNNGRYDVQRGACAVHLESPQVSLRNGRLVIRSHVGGRFGVDVGGNQCLGVALSSWVTVSGSPTAQGTVVRLVNVRLDDVDDPNIRVLLDAGLTPVLPSAFEFDVLKAVRTMLQGVGGQIQAEVQTLDIQAVAVADNKLSIRFDFKLVGR